MSFHRLCELLQNQQTSIALRESLYGYPAIETSHVVTIVMFAGLIAMMDLRLAGWAYRRTPFSQIQARLFPWQMFTFVLSSISGFALFYIEPLRFYDNWFFWIKMVLLLLAGVNAMVFHYTTYHSIAGWDTDTLKLPASARAAGIASLALWTGVIVTGRLIAYGASWLKW